MRPNAPRMVTVLASLALIVVGLAGSGLLPWDLLAIPAVQDILQRYDVTLTREIAYICLLGGPMLLVVGSLLPGI
jgi:hypothetical protein